MDLRRVAAKFETTSFDVFNETTQLWETGGMVGKIMPIDRFLSIFHRATRRRALGLPPSATLPASRTIRDPATGQAYVVGLVRGDSAKAIHYDSVGVLHGCDVVAEVFRKAPVGPVNDPGALVSSSTGVHYMDLELRSASEADETVQTYESHFFLTCPAHTDITQWDYVSYLGKTYEVQASYNDSGLTMCRVVERIDPRVDVTFHKKGAGSGYNPSTDVVTSGMVDYTVSGFFKGFSLDDVDGEAVSSGDVQFIIQQTHIGVVPSAEDQLTWDGQRYNIKAVQQDFLSHEYHLHCRI
jgi:hypothetical protein